MALDSVSFATLQTAAIRSDEVYQPADAEAAMTELGDEQRRFQTTAQEIAFNGYGDTGYWSRRTKNLALETAAHCCMAASLCDGPMQAALGDSLRQTLSQVENTAFNGHGDTSYWSRRAKRIAREEALDLPLDQLQAVQRSPGAEITPEVTELNRSFVNRLKSKTFGPTGDTDFWSKRAKEVAFLGTAQVAHLGILDALGHASTPEQRAESLQKIEDLVERHSSKMQDKAWSSRGGTSHWSKRAKHLGFDAARAVTEVVENCDRDQVQAIRPLLESMMAEAEDVAFDGYGGTRYWSTRAKKLAAVARTALSEAAVELKARQAIDPQSPPEQQARTYLENSVEGLQGIAAARATELAGIDAKLGQVGAIKARNAPERSKLIKRHNLLRKVGLGSALAMIVGMGARSFSPLFLGVAALGGLGTVGSILGVQSTNAKLAALNQQHQVHDSELLERRKNMLALEIGRIESRLKAQETELDVFSLAAPPEGPTGVEFNDDELIVGDVALKVDF